MCSLPVQCSGDPATSQLAWAPGPGPDICSNPPEIRDDRMRALL